MATHCNKCVLEHGKSLEQIIRALIISPSALSPAGGSANSIEFEEFNLTRSQGTHERTLLWNTCYTASAGVIRGIQAYSWPSTFYPPIANFPTDGDVPPAFFF